MDWALQPQSPLQLDHGMYTKAQTPFSSVTEGCQPTSDDDYNNDNDDDGSDDENDGNSNRMVENDDGDDNRGEFFN